MKKLLIAVTLVIGLLSVTYPATAASVCSAGPPPVCHAVPGPKPKIGKPGSPHRKAPHKPVPARSVQSASGTGQGIHVSPHTSSAQSAPVLTPVLTERGLYVIWDWMQAVMGLLLDWKPVF